MTLTSLGIGPGGFLTAPALFVLFLVWFIAGVRLTVGDPMDRSNRIALWYGYTVCLIAVVTFLTAGKGVIDNSMLRTHPLSGSDRYSFVEPDFSSFDAWKATQQNRLNLMERDSKAADRAPEPDSVLRPRYEALRLSASQSGVLRATRGLLEDGFLLVASLVLFASHWLFVRRQSGENEPVARA